MNEKVKKNPKIPPVGVVVKEGVRIGIVRMIEDRDRVDRGFPQSPFPDRYVSYF